MKNRLWIYLAACSSVVCLVPAVHAQTYLTNESIAPQRVPIPVSQPELDSILAPVALYPDALLTQILMAATYPAEVAEAARWSRAIPGLGPQEAVESVAKRDWDPSVQSLMAFPQVLEMMDSHMEWTMRLGDAFLSQQAQVWGTVQELRQRAYAAGNLRSGEQLRVLHNGAIIVVEPAQVDVVYVPYYDPMLVYGRWWWPGYAPMRWNPWPGYAAQPVRGPSYFVGPAIHIGLNFFFGGVNWNTYHATIHPEPRERDRPNRPWHNADDWEHNPKHRTSLPVIPPPSPPARNRRPDEPGRGHEPRDHAPTTPTTAPVRTEPRNRVEPAPVAPPAAQTAPPRHGNPPVSQEPSRPPRSATPTRSEQPVVRTPETRAPEQTKPAPKENTREQPEFKRRDVDRP